MKPAIIDIPGVGPAAVRALAEQGIGNLQSLAGASIEQVAAVPGFSTARADKVIAAATDLLAASGIATLPTADKPKKHGKKGGKKDRKGKKHKKKRKGKGKKKDK